MALLKPKAGTNSSPKRPGAKQRTEDANYSHTGSGMDIRGYGNK